MKPQEPTAAFDAIAAAYDDHFTHSKIGQLQRARVYQYLKLILAQQDIHQVLEVNCGTGADALWLAQQGCQVLATDQSSGMVQVATAKVAAAGLTTKVACQAIDMLSLQEQRTTRSYDLIFSNFGGFNCLETKGLEQVLARFQSMLAPKGYLVLVVMPKFCLWETLYFLYKRQFKTAFRRRSKTAVAAALDATTSVPTWYYNPKQIITHCPDLQHQFTQPIGFLLPPSYLEPWFVNKTNWLTRFHRWELRSPSFLAPYSDHYLIALQKNDN